MTFRQTASVFACTFACLAAACGGSDDAPAPASPPAAAPAPVPAPAPGPAPGPDTQAPTATLTAPSNLATGVTGTVTLVATASDNVGVAGVQFQVDGVDVGTELTTAPYQALVNLGAHAAGQHVLSVRSRDAAGNLSPWSSATVRTTGPGSLAPGFTKNEAWVTGLNFATAIAQAPDGRLFVAQQGGLLRVIKNNVLLPTAFHQFTVDANGERGLIGVTLHPDFANNGQVYVHYTSPSGGAHNRVSRIVASNTNPDVSSGTEAVLVDLPNLSAATNHNGGALHFGTDGKLYLGVGDNTQSARAPDLASPFGKLLRFNDDGSIPTDNPHYGTQTGLARAIWARGLRNPFTFAVQPGTGRIHINDVGEATWEEINVGQAGANYGWPASEGPVAAAGVTSPLLSYKHSDAVPAGSGPGGFLTGFSIAGGAFYPATGAYPAPYRGQYFFADFIGKFVARTDLVSGQTSTFARLAGNPVDMQVGQDGALYVLTRSSVTRITAP